MKTNIALSSMTLVELLQALAQLSNRSHLQSVLDQLDDVYEYGVCPCICPCLPNENYDDEGLYDAEINDIGTDYITFIGHAGPSGYGGLLFMTYSWQGELRDVRISNNERYAHVADEILAKAKTWKWYGFDGAEFFSLSGKLKLGI